MLRFTITIILCIACCPILFAQNVVPNCSFENYTLCPNSVSQVANCISWRQYALGTSDYFNTCSPTNVTFSVNVPANYFGYEYAAHGSAYMGTADYMSNTNYREYIATTFPALTINTVYEVSMSVSLADNSTVASNGLGVYFYQNGPTTIPGSSNILPVTPQISYASYGPITNKTGWVRIKSAFIADSGYTNLVIGGFLNPSQITTTPSSPQNGATSYYYIDSVVVKPVIPIEVNYPAAIVCREGAINVPYIAAPLIFNTGNVFTLQLSDASGSFVSPVNIGSVSSTTSGTIAGTIPANTIAGGGYRVRVVSSNSAHISNDNGFNIAVAVPALSAMASSPVCEGGNINLSASAASGTTYSWAGPSSYSNTLQNPVIAGVTPVNGGDYVVTATLANCTEKDTVTVIVNPKPVISAAGNNGPLCAGATLHLTATGNGSSYQWTGPSFTSTQQNPSINNVATGNQGTYTITCMLNGCTSLPVSTQVTIYPIPNAPTVGSNSPVCITNTINLTATGNPGALYSWTGPASFTAAVQNPSISNAALNMSGMYSVTATENGCTSPAGSTQVVVLYSPASVACYALPGDSICVGSSVNLIAVSTNGGSTPQFQWLKNGQLIAGANSISYSPPSLVSGDKFSVIMTANSSCSLPDTSTDKAITILPWVIPAVNIAATPGGLISPWQMVTFNTSVSNGGANPAFQWKRNGQDVNGAVYNTWGASTLSNNDTVWVEMTSNEKCPAPATVVSNKIVIQIKTGVDDASKTLTSLAIFPNPNKGQFVLTGELPGNEALHLQVINSIGQVVYSAYAHTKNKIVNTEITLPGGIAAGVYLLRLQNSGINETARIVVE
jgi:hypothetical protein